MDEIRRGAMAKMGRYAAGAVGLAGTLGRGNVAVASEGAFAQMDAAAAPESMGRYPTDMAKSQHNMIEKSSPISEARWKAVAPLRAQVEDLEGYTGWRASNFMHVAQNNSYLSTLRSTAPHWRAQVIMDRQKAKQSAIATIQEQINKMLRSPLDTLEETAREAIQGFLAEMQKP